MHAHQLLPSSFQKTLQCGGCANITAPLRHWAVCKLQEGEERHQHYELQVLALGLCAGGWKRGWDLLAPAALQIKLSHCALSWVLMKSQQCQGLMYLLQSFYSKTNKTSKEATLSIGHCIAFSQV